MDSAIVGAGSIGSYLALRASEAGHRPLICARSTEPARIESQGVGHLLDSLDHVVDPGRAAPVDLVLLAVKAQDVPGIASWLDALIGERTTIAIVQNGIEHGEGLPPSAASASIVPALAYVNVERAGAREYVHHAGDKIVVPQVAGADELADYFRGSALTIEGVEDFDSAAWLKLLGNLAANPLTTLTMGRLGIVTESVLIRALAEGLIAEGVAVGAADGAELGEEHVGMLMETFATYPKEAGTSMLFDRLGGRRLEHEALTGALLRKAEKHGIEVPLNTTIFALLDGLDHSIAEAR